MGASWGLSAQLMRGGCSSQEEAQREAQQTDVRVGPDTLFPRPASPGAQGQAKEGWGQPRKPLGWTVNQAGPQTPSTASAPSSCPPHCSTRRLSAVPLTRSFAHLLSFCSLGLKGPPYLANCYSPFQPASNDPLHEEAPPGGLPRRPRGSAPRFPPLAPPWLSRCAPALLKVGCVAGRTGCQGRLVFH